MKVFIITEGWWYEGEDIIEVYATKADAVKRVKELISIGYYSDRKWKWDNEFTIREGDHFYSITEREIL